MNGGTVYSYEATGQFAIAINVNSSGAKFIMNDGTVTSEKGNAVSTSNNTTTEITGGTLSSGGRATVSGSMGANQTVTISGGTIKNTSTRSIEQGQNSTLNITAGTIEEGVLQRGTINISGGTFQEPLEINNTDKLTIQINLQYKYVSRTWSAKDGNGSGTTKVSSTTVTTPASSIIIAAGETVTIAPAPATGSQVKEISVYKEGHTDETVVVTGNTFTMPEYPVCVKVTYEKIKYTITINPKTGANIDPSGAVLVEYGKNQTFTITAKKGYELISVKLNGVDQALVNDQITLTNVLADAEIKVTAEEITYNVTLTSDSGATISPKDTTVTYGENKEFTILPKEGYKIKSVRVNGVEQTLVNNKLTLTDVKSNLRIVVETEELQKYTITVNPVTGATIDPNGVITVAKGENKEFTITANEGYEIKSVKVDGIEQTLVDNKLTLTNIEKDSEIVVEVKEKQKEEVPTQDPASDNTPKEEKDTTKKDSTSKDTTPKTGDIIYTIIGVLLVIIIGNVVYITKRKKTAKRA